MDDNNKQNRKEKRNERDKNQNTAEDAAKNQSASTRNSSNTANQARYTTQSTAQQQVVQSPPVSMATQSHDESQPISMLSSNLMRENPHNLTSTSQSASLSLPSSPFVHMQGVSPASTTVSNLPSALAASSLSSGANSLTDFEKQVISASASMGHGNAPYNWQSSKTSVKDRLSYLYNTEIMSDIHFLVGTLPNQQRIPAHKFILSVGSAVFDAQFNGPMATTEDVVEIPDVEPGAFLALLRFLYTDEVQICSDTVMTTLYTAKKYAVPSLEKACVEFLKRNLSSDNAFLLLTQARLFDEPQLAALCLETIDKNTTEALVADGFTDIDNDTLCVVLERDTLGIRECKLFAAVCRWAEAECRRKNLAPSPENQRSVLGRCLRLIRFPLMSVEEFAQGAAQSRLLEDREVVQLFLYFTVNPKPQISFLDVPRCCLTGKEQVVSRFCQIESRWGYSGTSDRIRFMVNRRIFVVGFGLYGSIHGPTEYAVNIQIIMSESTKVMGQNDTSFQCDGSNSTFRVMFKEPVEILPNCSYTACATLKGPDSYYGAKGLRKVTHESVSSGKVTFQFTYAAGNNNGTSVEDGQIPEIIFYT